jgi:hypothetical protein
VIEVGVGDDHVLERDGVLPEIVQELPADEVGRALLRHLLLVGHARVHQVPGIVGRSHQDGIALSHVDHVELEQPLGGEHGLGNPPLGLAGLDPGAPVLGLLDAHGVAPEEMGDRLVVVGLQRDLELAAHVVDERVAHGGILLSVPGTPRILESGGGSVKRRDVLTGPAARLDPRGRVLVG